MNNLNNALLAALLCGGLVTVAQAQDTKSTKPPTAPTSPMFMTNLMPPGAASRPMMRDRTEMLARMLNLTEEQKAKVKPVIEAETKQLEEIRAKTLEKLKPILTEEQYTRFSRMGTGGPGMALPPRTGAPPNVQVSPPTTTPSAPANK